MVASRAIRPGSLKLNDEQGRALVAMIEAVRLGDPWVALEADRSRAMGVRSDPHLGHQQILSRKLRALGYRKLSARPRHHAHDEAAVVAFRPRTPASIAATIGKPLDSVPR